VEGAGKLTEESVASERFKIVLRYLMLITTGSFLTNLLLVVFGTNQ
jgi:hypothetical protein